MPLDHEALKQARLEALMTQSDAAFMSGMKQSAWARFESGRRPDPSLSTLEKMARALNVPVSRIITRHKRARPLP
jgi:transcriptional regulator with XRE-family HTH domain